MRTPLLIALAALATTAFAPGQPDPDRRPNALGSFQALGAVDVDFAMRELCFPYVLGEGQPSELTVRSGVFRLEKPPAWAKGRPTWWVGRRDLQVSMASTRNGGRACSVIVLDGDPAPHRAALDQAMTHWRTPLHPAAPLAPGGFASREAFCAPATAPSDAQLIYTAKPKTRPMMMITLLTTPGRDPRCDPPG